MLTEAQAAFKAELEAAQNKVRIAEKNVRVLLGKCVHVVAPLSETELKKQKKDRWYSNYAGCEICYSSLGWRCAESPDGVCHYFTEFRDWQYIVSLIGGVQVPVPRRFHDDADEAERAEPYDPDYETSDTCLFCGNPEERK